MGKKNKAAKRLARYRAEAQQEVLNREIISKQTAEALYKLCLPILPEYIDDSQECESGWAGDCFQNGHYGLEPCRNRSAVAD